MSKDEWIEKDEALQKEYVFDNQTQAAQFALKVAQLSDQMDHHADIELYAYRKLRLRITSHDAGKLTKKDVIWTERVDREIPLR